MAKYGNHGGKVKGGPKGQKTADKATGGELDGSVRKLGGGGKSGKFGGGYGCMNEGGKNSSM